MYAWTYGIKCDITYLEITPQICLFMLNLGRLIYCMIGVNKTSFEDKTLMWKGTISITLRFGYEVKNIVESFSYFHQLTELNDGQFNIII